MSDAPEVFRHDGFGRKLGPLPVWGWAIVLAGVAFVYVRFIHGSVTGSSAGSSAAAPAYPNVQTTGGYLPPVSGSGSMGSGSGPVGFTDNTSWENAAIQQASTFGSDPISLQQALDAYMKGSSATITPTQGGLINKVIESLGAPPISSGNGTPVVQTPAARTFKEFVQDSSAGTIGAEFSDGSISPYNNWNVFAAARQTPGMGSSPVVAIGHDAFTGAKQLPINYQPGWEKVSA
jgi:hypothetical protein